MHNLKMLKAAGVGLLTVAATPVLADDGLMGVNALVFNTFTGGLTDGVETDVGMFGMNNNLFATVGDGVEWPSFIALYDIDLDADSVAFSWVETGFSASVTGPTPDGNHDRNYIVFDLPAGTAITSIEFDASRSTLLEGSAEPTAQVVSRNKIVTDFAGGVVRGPGFAPVFTITTGDAE